MIELQTLQGEKIDLLSNTVTIELNNSLFHDGAQFKGSFSYPISLAMSANNIRLFEFANQLETAIKHVAIPVRVRIGSVAFKKAMMSLSVGANSFEGVLKMGIDGVNERIRTKKISDIKFTTFYIGGRDTQIRESMIQAAKNTDWQKIPYTFFPVSNPSFCGNSREKVSSLMSRRVSLVNEMSYYNGFCRFDIPNAANNQHGQIVPYFYLSYVLNEIAKWLGFDLKGDFLNHPDIKNIVIYNINSTRLTRVSSLGNEQGNEFNRAKGMHIAPNNHLPSLTIAEFFKAICSFFGCHIWVDEKNHSLNISWKKSVFDKRLHLDWSKKMIRVEDQRLSESGGYLLSGQVNGSSPKDEVVFGQGKNKLEAQAGTLEFITAKVPGWVGDGLQWQIPSDTQTGNIIDPLFSDLENYTEESTKKTFPLRFLFYKGLTAAVQHPQCSTQGQYFDLKISGDKGLFKFSHQHWLENTRETKNIKVKLMLNGNDLNQLNDQNIIILKSNNGATVECILKKLTFTSSKDQTTAIADAELVVLDSVRIATATGATVPEQSKHPIVSKPTTAPIEPPPVEELKIFVRLTVVEKIGKNGYGEAGVYMERLDIDAFLDEKCTTPYQPDNLTVEYTLIRSSKTMPYRGGEPSVIWPDQVFPFQATLNKTSHLSIKINTTKIMKEASYPYTEVKENISTYRLKPSPNYTIVP